ncbi:MAG TPA: DUF4238 domain-containing protein, partial [Bacteroidota bacterium]|nr:DUF4238 domain-containing protein [Bacteroidota bacterium]
KQKVVKDGIDPFKDISYSDAKRIILEEEWEVKGHPNSFHPMEFNAMKKIVQLLANRDWSLILAPANVYFITIDRPVVLDWTVPDSSAPFGPGFGSLHSAVYFSLNKSMAILGRFNDTSRLLMFLASSLASLILVWSTMRSDLHMGQQIHSLC